MALFHLSVTQTKRSAGQSAIASAAYRAGERLYSEYLDRMKIEEQKKAVRSGYDMEILPSDLATYGGEAKKILDDLQSRNERMFLVTVLFLNTAKTKQELDSAVFQTAGIAQKFNCTLNRLDYLQEQGLMSSLPLANNLVPIKRALTTTSTAIFVPFTTQELFMEGDSLYYGLNAVSNNMIMADRKQLKNPNGLILGTPGSGKSFSAKREITNVFFTTTDDIIVADPEGEYYPLVEALGGQVIHISSTSKDYINPMDINLNYADDDNPLGMKSDFILSLCELIMGARDGMEPEEKSVIDRCLPLVYQKYLNDPKPENMPTLGDLYDCLREQKERQAQRIATALEIYVNGSLRVFNHQTNGMIGLAEMHDYGYLKDDVLPLTKEGAREWHRLGERIYPLFRDGTAGDYVSQEGIEQHDGIFGIKADAWDAILLEQREDYAEDEYARPDFQLTVINREQALRLYDEGKQIYLVRISPWPILVTAREEIERGSDTFQIAIADLEQERNLAEQENMLLYGSEKQLGIYQITARDPEHDYRFMGLDFVRKKGMTVARADYDLIYTAPLTEKDTLDGIYERFNIQRPADFTGHSLSVSDVVVLNDGNTVKAYYVDSIGFAELPGFFKERNMDLQKETLLNEELQEIEIFDKPGLFSNGRLRDEDVPEGLYRYDLRGSDYDPGQPITVEKTVVVNHAASVLMAEELDLGAEGRLELGKEGLNFTGAELTVREFMEEQQQKRSGLIHGDSDHIAVEGHIGTWYAVDETEVGGEKFFLLEHEEHGDMAACVAVNEQGKLVAEDLWNGFDDEFLDAVKEYLSEKWNMPNKDDVVSEIIEKAAPVPDNSAQDYSDVPVYYEPFSYAKENDEVDLYRTSYRLNSECKQAIHEAIADNYDGMYLGDGAVNQVVRQYGMERVGYILANTLRYKNYDDRFSHSNKEWAEQVGTPENNARIIKFRADWVVTSHSAVLDGFVTMYREKLEKQKELEQPFVKRFYVVENRQAVPLEIKRFGNLDDAMSQYQALPSHYMKALGVEKNPDPLSGSLDVLQCKNGIDTIVEDYKTVPGWDNPYVQNHVVQPLQGALAVQEVELAYKLPDAYFHIQTCEDGFDYTLYNKDFTERDGGILETDGDKPVQEAMTELLAEFGCDAAEGRVMDAAELREQADMVAEQQAEVLKEKLAAERPAPEETLSFYVAECLEFTFAGEFHDHLTMEEALEVYDKIPSERMNADKCIGFCIEEDGGFVGMYELVVNDKVQRENINSINYFRDDKLVQQAISDMEKLMSERQQSKEQERGSTKKSVLDALRSLKAKKQEQPAQEQDKPKKAKKKGMEL